LDLCYRVQANGMQCYVASLLIFLGLLVYGPEHGIKVSWVYHHMGELLSAMNVFSLVFCLFLLIKGLTIPSTTDSGSSGNWVIDFYWLVGELVCMYAAARGACGSLLYHLCRWSRLHIEWRIARV
jgi:hypothetical protein